MAPKLPVKKIFVEPKGKASSRPWRLAPSSSSRGPDVVADAEEAMAVDDAGDAGLSFRQKCLRSLGLTLRNVSSCL